MRFHHCAFAALAFGTMVWGAEAAPIPASATGLAGASYSLDLSGGTILGVFALPDTTTSAATGISTTIFPIGPAPSTDCAPGASSCAFGGAAGGVVVAVDGTATLANFVGGYGFVLLFPDNGTLTLTVLASSVSLTLDPGNEPTGTAFADGLVASPLFDEEAVFSTAAGAVTTIDVAAGLHGLVWNGAGVALAASRSLDAAVPEPTGLALVGLGAMFVARSRKRRLA